MQLIIENEENIIQDIVEGKRSWWNSSKNQYQFLQSSSFYEYPEMESTYRQIVDIIYETATSKISPVPEIAKLYHTCGVSRSALEKIFDHFGLILNWDEINAVRQKNSFGYLRTVEQPASTKQILLDIGMVSNDSCKHDYVRNEENLDNPYFFPDVEARLLAIIDDQKILSIDTDGNNLPDHVNKVLRADVSIRDQEFGFVFDRTNFASECGNQCYDTGFITFDDKYTIKVNRVKKTQFLIIHYGELLFK